MPENGIVGKLCGFSIQKQNNWSVKNVHANLQRRLHKLLLSYVGMQFPEYVYAYARKLRLYQERKESNHSNVEKGLKMARQYTSEIVTREDADKYLGNKRERPLPRCANLRIGRVRTMLEGPNPVYTEEIVVQLHGHIIVHWDKDGNKTFPYKGMHLNSPTTKRHRSAFGGPWKVV